MRFFSGSISSGKTAPSLFLHKQLDVTYLTTARLLQFDPRGKIDVTLAKGPKVFSARVPKSLLAVFKKRRSEQDRRPERSIASEGSLLVLTAFAKK